MVSHKFSVLLVLFYFVFKTDSIEKSNVCSDFISYYTKDPKKCWHNPDVYLPGPAIILRHNYPLILYNVTTKDGYILTMFRMPKENRKGVVYIQAPFLSNSVVFVDKGNHSLAFMLWDAGYDVWLGNFRETAYGKRHKLYHSESKEFWNFSFHENAVYDIPAQIELIVNITEAKSQELTYIGVSMSGTTGIVYSSLFPEESYKLFNLFILMAPTTYTENYSPWFYEVARSTNNILKISNYLGVYEFTGWVFLANFLSICRDAPLMIMCLVLENIFFGNVPEDQNPEWVPLRYAHCPDSVPTKTAVHFGQMAEARKFQMFDHGREGNLNHYGSERPPLYPIQNIKVPIYLIYSDTDGLIPLKDLEEFYESLPQRAKIFGKRIIKSASHISFLYGRRVKKLVYTPIVEIINQVAQEKNKIK